MPAFPTLKTRYGSTLSPNKEHFLSINNIEALKEKHPTTHESTFMLCKHSLKPDRKDKHKKVVSKWGSRSWLGKQQRQLTWAGGSSGTLD